MNRVERAYQGMYKNAKQETDLRWHRETIPPFVISEMERLPKGSEVLDIGCGTGVFSVYMAEKGMNVTAIDFMPKAIEFAKARNAKAGVNINFQQADITTWKPNKKFKLILDSGCFHSFTKDMCMAYRPRLLDLLDKQGKYILLHFGKRHFLDFSIIPPNRKTKQQVDDFFTPELELKDFVAVMKPRGVFHYLFNRRN